MAARTNLPAERGPVNSISLVQEQNFSAAEICHAREMKKTPRHARVSRVARRLLGEMLQREEKLLHSLSGISTTPAQEMQKTTARPDSQRERREGFMKKTLIAILTICVAQITSAQMT